MRTLKLTFIVLIGTMFFTGCKKTYLPEGKYINEAALPEDYHLLEVRKDTLFWETNGKVKSFVYHIKGKELMGTCLNKDENLKRLYKSTEDGFYLDKIRFYACPKEYDRIPDGEYEEYNAFPKYTLHLVVKGNKIIKTDTRYDEVLSSQEFTYSILPSKRAAILTHNGSRSQQDFLTTNDGFMLSGVRFVKKK